AERDTDPELLRALGDGIGDQPVDSDDGQRERGGLPPDAARAQAIREFGDVGMARIELAAIDRRRAARAGRSEWWSGLWHDVRYAARGLRNRPAFAVIVLGTLAIGIGANTAIFTVVDAALFRGLPYVEPERLVHLWESAPDHTSQRSEASYPDFEDWRAGQTTLAAIAGYQTNGIALTGRDVPLMLPITYVTPGFFDVLGVRAFVGRTIHESQDRIGDRVVMLGHGLWQREFSGDAGVVGQTIALGGVPHTVVGVLPPEFHFAGAEGGDLWTITDLSRSYQRVRGVHWLNVIGRLKDGVTPAQAVADLSAVVRRIAQQHADSHTGREAAVVPLHDQFVGSMRPLLLVLLSAVSIVLLIACANVAGLLLARATARQQELAVRAALGAGRGRITRQLLTESVLLAVLGGLLGLGVARIGVRALVAALPEQQRVAMPYLDGLGVDVRVLTYALLVALVTGVAFGLFPALQASRASLAPTLAAAGGRTMSGRRRTVRNALVVGEVALTVVLLVGAGLLTQSLVRLLRVDPGFRPERVLTAAILLPPTKYADSATITPFYRELVTRIEALPGVSAVGLTSRLPLDWGNSGSYVVVGRPEPPPGQRPSASIREVSTGYFRAMGIPLLRGRDFAPHDGWNAPRVLVVNRALAKQQFGAQSPVGQQLAFGPSARTILGVVEDVPIDQIGETPTPTVYRAHLQYAERGMFMAVRTTTDPTSIAASVRDIVRALDPDLPLAMVSTMERQIASSRAVFMRRYSMFLVAGFGAVALVLSIVGIYGVISYSVTQRMRELGVRVALGAQRGDILTMILRDGTLLVATGIALGLAAAFWLTRFLRALLFGIGTTDVTTYAAVALLLAAIALVASYVPARRATRVDPLVALRAAD
ncbi:MAG: ABC transporter permease, partial [Gemmatimonadota bacterium]|nr:ABC transporter permease [Gemmatimonadota bacterium]